MDGIENSMFFCNICVDLFSCGSSSNTGMDNSGSGTGEQKTLQKFVNRSATLWQCKSLQYNNHLESVRDKTICTGYPVRVVDDPSFK
jgi:hypothetical protein